MNLDALIYLLCLGGGFLFLVVLALMDERRTLADTGRYPTIEAMARMKE